MRSAWPVRLEGPGAVLLVAAAYAAVAKLGNLTTTLPGGISPIFPSAGIALAAILIMGRRGLPGVWLGSYAGNAIIYGRDLADVLLPSPRSALIAACIATSVAAAAWAGAGLVRRLAKGAPFPSSTRGVLVLVTAGAFGAAALSATGGLLILAVAGLVPWQALRYSWLTWVLGDAFGSIAVAPLILAWHGRPSGGALPRRAAEATALGGLTLLLCYLVFFRTWPFEYGLMPLLVWAAFRFGLRGTSTAAVAIALLATVGTSQGTSPFVRATVNDSLLALHSFLGVTITFALLMAGVLADRRRADEALRSSQERALANEERLRLATQVSEIGIFDQDHRTGAVYWSREQRVHLGWGPDEPVGAADLLGQVHADDRDRVRAALQRAQDPAGDGHLEEEYRVTHRGGPLRWLSTRSQTRFEGEGAARRAVRTVGATVDVTGRKRAQAERQQLEAQLLQSQKMEAVGRLAGGVAHDFNNLLTVIINNCVLALEDPGLAEESRHNVDMVREAGESAAKLTHQLLAFSRKQVLQPAVLDLNALVGRLERMLRRIIGEDIDLVTRPGPGLWPVLADPGQLEQVIVNLAVNSRDAMPAGGRLVIETGNVALDDAYGRQHPEVRPGDYVMLSVTDSGAGMDAETLSRVFEPFFSTKGALGTGLGLSTVHGIVRQTGGHVWPYSEPGRGTTFKIYLPRHVGADPAAEAAAEPLPAATRGRTVLVVEDATGVRTLVVNLLSRRAYRVLQAGDAEEALRVAADHPGVIDLVITDVVLPGMSGRQLAARLAEARPGAAVLYMSGYTEDAIVHHGMLDAGIDFIAKPFTLDAMLRKVEELLRRAP